MGVEQVMVRQAYRYALDPTPAQERALLRHVGARRWAYNHAVTALLDVRTYGSSFDKKARPQRSSAPAS